MQRLQGFTLIELAIVLIIIGLVAGGVVQGISLMEQAETKRVISDIQEYRQAVVQFQDKYEFLPGDMPNATMIWGRADGGADLTQQCASPETDISAANPQATCNGNGDGMIAWPFMGNHNVEAYRVWQQLGNAGLITGTYTGIGGTMIGSWRVSTPGVNVPESAIENSGYFIQATQLDSFCSPGQKWTGTDVSLRRTFLTLGARASTGWPWGRLISPEEGYTIDLKIDDGKPGKGVMAVFCQNTCATSTDTSTATYLTDNEGRDCTIAITIKR